MDQATKHAVLGFWSSYLRSVELAEEIRERGGRELRCGLALLKAREGVTLRDAAEVIGVSFQRLSQISSGN